MAAHIRVRNNNNNAFKPSDQCKEVSGDVLHVCLLRYCSSQPCPAGEDKMQALRDNIGDYTPLAVRANRKVIRSVWQYGDGGRGYVTQLSRKPRPLSKPN